MNASTGKKRTTPTPEEVRAGRHGGNAKWGHGAVDAGNITVATASVTASANVTNLTLTNDVWVVAAATDCAPASSSAALQPYVSLIVANTKDAAPPAFASGTPTFRTEAFLVNATIALDEPGVAYLVVQAPGTQAPSSAQVMARAGGASPEALSCVVNVTRANVLTYCAVSGLNEVTSYSAYLVTRDNNGDAPNASPSPTRFDFTTRDETPPIGALSITSVHGVGFEIKADSTKNGTVYWGVVPAGSVLVPIVGYTEAFRAQKMFEDVRNNGTAASPFNASNAGAFFKNAGSFTVSGVNATARGNASRALTVGVATGTVNVTGLTPERAYDFYAVFSDDADNPSFNLSSSDTFDVFNTTLFTLAYVTTLDVTPPAFVGGFDATPGGATGTRGVVAAGRVSRVTATGFDLTARLNEPGIVRYAVTPHAAAQTLGATATTGAPLVWANAPSVEEIVGCVGRCRVAAAACGAFAVPTRNVDATTLVRTVDLATHAGCVEGGPGGGYAAGADAAYKTAVAGGAYTVADWRGAIANDARNFSAFNASFNATTRAASLVGAARCDADGDGVEDALASLPPSPSRASACPWLSPEGAYDVWVVAEDDGNDVLANASAGGNGTTTAANRGTHAFRALPPNPENWTGPSLVVADVAPPTFTASYPALIDLNGSALRFDASLSEPGAVVFALRLNASSDPVATRAGIEARANFSAISREPYAALVPGANAGVLNVTDANVNVSHVITDLPEPDLSSTRRGATLAVDYFAIDIEPTRLSSLTRSTRAVPNAGPVRVATRKMSDVEPPVWTASGAPKAAAVPVAAATVNASLAGGAGGGAALARLVVHAETDENATVYFVVARNASANYSHARPEMTPTRVMNASTGSAAYPVVASGSFRNFTGATRSPSPWTSPGYPLAQSEKYAAWFVAVDNSTDDARGANAQEDVVLVPFVAPDFRPPTFTTRGPRAWCVRNTSFSPTARFQHLIASPFN